MDGEDDDDDDTIEQRWHLGMTNYRYKAIIGGFSELLNRFIITRQ